MKLRKLTDLLLTFAMAALLMTGCGASTNTKSEMAMPEAAAPMEAPAMEEMKYAANDAIYSTSVSGNTSANVQTGQKLIRKVHIDAETEDLETLLGSLTSQISALGGYIEQQELYNGSSYSSYRHRSANLTVRIPAEKLDSFIGQVKDVSNVVSYNESQDDVTLT